MSALLEYKIIFSQIISSQLLHQQFILKHVSLTFICPRRLTSIDLFIIHTLFSPTLFWREVFKPGHHLCTGLTFAKNYTYTQRFKTSQQPRQTNYTGSLVPVGRVFANGPGDRCSIPDRVIQTTLMKMVLDTSLLNTHHYKVRIKGKVLKSREKGSALPYSPV